jgi:hypothetical protein
LKAEEARAERAELAVATLLVPNDQTKWQMRKTIRKKVRSTPKVKKKRRRVVT